jgi:hypothetical protein
MRLTLSQRGDALLVDIEADHADPACGGGYGEREPDVPESDDAGCPGLGAESFDCSVNVCRNVGTSRASSRSVGVLNPAGV